MNQNFILKFVVISYIQTAIIQDLSFDDPATSNAINFILPPSTGSMISYEIIPKLFASNLMNLTLTAAIPANQFISVNLLGWYEDK